MGSNLNNTQNDILQDHQGKQSIRTLRTKLHRQVIQDNTLSRYSSRNSYEGQKFIRTFKTIFHQYTLRVHSEKRQNFTRFFRLKFYQHVLGGNLVEHARQKTLHKSATIFQNKKLKSTFLQDVLLLLCDCRFTRRTRCFSQFTLQAVVGNQPKACC